MLFINSILATTHNSCLTLSSDKKDVVGVLDVIPSNICFMLLVDLKVEKTGPTCASSDKICFALSSTAGSQCA